MAEKRLTAYQLGGEWTALLSLLNEMTDENGVTRELTDDDKKFFKEETDRIGGDIKDKMNGICKVFKNFKMEAEIAKAEKDALSAELDRLSKRAKARENEADRVKGLLSYLMDIVGMKKIKTELFSAGYQATQKSVKEVQGFFNPDLIPSEFLKREINPTAVKKAIEENKLYEKDGNMNRTKLFYLDTNGKETQLTGVSYVGGETLVIR